MSNHELESAQQRANIATGECIATYLEMRKSNVEPIALETARLLYSVIASQKREVVVAYYELHRLQREIGGRVLKLDDEGLPEGLRQRVEERADKLYGPLSARQQSRTQRAKRKERLGYEAWASQPRFIIG